MQWGKDYWLLPVDVAALGFHLRGSFSTWIIVRCGSKGEKGPSLAPGYRCWEGLVCTKHSALHNHGPWDSAQTVERCPCKMPGTLRSFFRGDLLWLSARTRGKSSSKWEKGEFAMILCDQLCQGSLVKDSQFVVWFGLVWFLNDEWLHRPWMNRVKCRTNSETHEWLLWHLQCLDGCCFI